jgi:hypothetical protein
MFNLDHHRATQRLLCLSGLVPFDQYHAVTRRGQDGTLASLYLLQYREEKSLPDILIPFRVYRLHAADRPDESTPISHVSFPCDWSVTTRKEGDCSFGDFRGPVELCDESHQIDSDAWGYSIRPLIWSGDEQELLRLICNYRRSYCESTNAAIDLARRLFALVPRGIILI